jgi:hypothetical protein
MLITDDERDDGKGNVDRDAPVYLKLIDHRAIPSEVAGRLPEGRRLSQHQLGTHRALTVSTEHND